MRKYKINKIKQNKIDKSYLYDIENNNKKIKVKTKKSPKNKKKIIQELDNQLKNKILPEKSYDPYKDIIKPSIKELLLENSIKLLQDKSYNYLLEQEKLKENEYNALPYINTIETNTEELKKEENERNTLINEIMNELSKIPEVDYDDFKTNIYLNKKNYKSLNYQKTLKLPSSNKLQNILEDNKINYEIKKNNFIINKKDFDIISNEFHQSKEIIENLKQKNKSLRDEAFNKILSINPNIKNLSEEGKQIKDKLFNLPWSNVLLDKIISKYNPEYIKTFTNFPNINEFNNNNKNQAYVYPYEDKTYNHWKSLYIINNELHNFDSLDLPLSNKEKNLFNEIKTKYGIKKFYKNNIKIQSDFSSLCGPFCAYWIIETYNNNNPHHLINFHKNNIKNYEKALIDWEKDLNINEFII